MNPRNAEFKALFDASGLDNAEVGRILSVHRATVGRYLTGEIEVPQGAIDLFKFSLSHRNPDAIAAAQPKPGDGDGHALHERPSESDTDLWRRRAKSAEEKIAQLREGLRNLLDQTSPDKQIIIHSPAKAPSLAYTSAQAKKVGAIAERVSRKESSSGNAESGRSSEADERTSRKDALPPSSLNPTKARLPGREGQEKK